MRKMLKNTPKINSAGAGVKQTVLEFSADKVVLNGERI